MSLNPHIDKKKKKKNTDENMTQCVIKSENSPNFYIKFNVSCKKLE